MLTDLERRVARAAARRDESLEGHAATRRAHGIVHTPPELARYLARAVDGVLVDGLGRAGGLGDPGVAVVDPACGPGAFMAAVLAEARAGGPAALVGIDRDADAAATAKALLAQAARDRGVPMALHHGDALASLAPFGGSLPSDATVVVLGNPPWRVGTGTVPPALAPLLDDFARDRAGRSLAERRIGVLRDAYVRFWRWAAEVARVAGGGAVVALVTNGSFVEGPVHRGMRAALASWFDAIDVLDLGGSALVARRGDRDDNVFGVRPAVSVTLAWRGARDGTTRGARIRHARLRGSRAEKLARLETARPEAFEWTTVRSRAPAHLFAPSAEIPWPEGSVPLPALMPFHREGVQTNRDAVAIDTERDRLLARLRSFVSGGADSDLERARRPLRHYDPERAREAVGRALEADPDGRRHLAVRPIAYRPFDARWLAPVAPLCHRPRPALLRAVDQSDLVLLTVRKDRGERAWAHFGATRDVPDNCWLSSRSSCRTRAFPTHGPDGRPNLDPQVADALGVHLETRPGVGEWLRYVLAVIAARPYRATFAEALRHDYPRIPPPPGSRQFERMVAAGDAVARAFEDDDAEAPDGAAPVTVGHRALHGSPALRRALALADEAYGQVIDPPSRVQTRGAAHPDGLRTGDR